MKKSKLLIAAASVLLLASCGDKTGKLEQSFGLPTLNLVVNTHNPEIAPTVAASTYAFHINYTDATLDLSVNSLSIGGHKLAFATDPLSYTNKNFSYFVTSAVVPVSGTSDFIQNLNCRLTSILVAPPENVVGDISFLPVNAAVMSYNWNNYTIRTFPADAVYYGETLTTASGQDDFATKLPTYRFYINPDKMTASMIIYNGKFSANPRMPALNLLLEDLKVIPNANGYVITGENVVPKTLAEGTPYPSFAFATLNFETLAADLTTAKLTFSINSPFGLLEGSFNGSYLINTSDLQ